MLLSENLIQLTEQSSSKQHRYGGASLATFVLVHGAWVGGWCFDPIIVLLEAKGHTALAVSH